MEDRQKDTDRQTEVYAVEKSTNDQSAKKKSCGNPHKIGNRLGIIERAPPPAPPALPPSPPSPSLPPPPPWFPQIEAAVAVGRND